MDRMWILSAPVSGSHTQKVLLALVTACHRSSHSHTCMTPTVRMPRDDSTENLVPVVLHDVAKPKCKALEIHRER